MQAKRLFFMDCAFRAVLFDVGQTLICSARSVGEIYSTVATKYGVCVNPEELNDSFRALWVQRRDTLHAGGDEQSERRWWYELIADAFNCAGLQCDRSQDKFHSRFNEFFSELFDLFTQPQTWCVFEDVAPVLDELSAHGVRLAVVSNWDSRLDLLLQRLDLKRRFEFVLTSARAGYRKPDPRIFQIALDRLGLPAGEVAYVGDSYEDDFVGAQQAGIKPILLDRKRQCPLAIATIQSLSELPRFLCAATVSTDPAESLHQ